MPWDPEWQAAAGTDAQIIVLDPATGREWDLWQVQFDGTTVTISNGNLVKGDYRTKEDGFKSSRGCGIQYLAMLVRPEEIMQGEIRHALSMPIRNPCGKKFVAPATKLEHPDYPEGIPEGMRFAIHATDEEIETWAKQLPGELSEVTRYAALVIACALRDYGWIITDTSGAAKWQFEYSGTAGEKWAAVGLENTTVGWKEYPRDLMDGLVREDNIYTIVPSDQYPPELRPQVKPGIR